MLSGGMANARAVSRISRTTSPFQPKLEFWLSSRIRVADIEVFAKGVYLLIVQLFKVAFQNDIIRQGSFTASVTVASVGMLRFFFPLLMMCGCCDTMLWFDT